MTTSINSQPQIYEGQYGQFTITSEGKKEVIIYRCGLILSAISFLIETNLVLFYPQLAINSVISNSVFFLFILGLGISLTKIHIYLKPLHNLLKIFWLIGTIFSIFLLFKTNQPIIEYVYNYPLNLFGLGFIFVALTGIYFKEAFCFNRLETKILTPLVTMLLLGHLVHILSVKTEKIGLGIWAILYLVFALRKFWQNIPSDIGDKSVFEHLKK